MILWEKVEKECKIIDICIPLDENVKANEKEKKDKYVPLSVALKRIYPEYTFSIIPIVLGATGLVTNSLTYNLKEIGSEIVNIWNKRKEKVESDYSIMGWALCVLPDVQKDVDNRLNSSLGVLRKKMENVIVRYFKSDVDKDTGEMIDIFWNEFKEFKNRTGPFSQESIWNVKDVREGNSHLWDEKYSYPYTIVLGKIACRVTSKLLGIGSAERSWGDVKHLKKDKGLTHWCEKISKTVNYIYNY